MDSPVLGALRHQQASAHDSLRLLHEGERALLAGDKATAIAKWNAAIDAGGGTAVDRVRLGLLFKDRSEWQKAMVQFERATREIPTYAEAHRELGIAQNKFAHSSGIVAINAGEDDDVPGEEQLKRALELNMEDFDAAASLGGIYKRSERLNQAVEMYRLSTVISNGHPYPLLNLIKLEAELCGCLDISAARKAMLMQAEKFRSPQTMQAPVYDAPWSHFDLAEIKMFLGAPATEIHEIVKRGISDSTATWQLKSFHDSLDRLHRAGVGVPGISEILTELKHAIYSANIAQKEL